MIKLTNQNDFDLIISSFKGLVLVDFYADWCDPCKWLDQILTSLEPEVTQFTTILKVDVETNTDIRKRFHIKGIPVLMLFKNGVEVWKMNGFLSERELFEKLVSFR